MNKKQKELDDSQQAGAVYTNAVLAMLLGLLSCTILFNDTGSLSYALLRAPVPIIGIFVSLSVLKAVREAPEGTKGRGLALLGLLMSGGFLAFGVAFGAVTHFTEVPNGYERTTFEAMKPTPAEEKREQPVTDALEQLINKKVFIKGYIRPDSVAYIENINKFLLVRDNKTCCVGDEAMVQFFDQVQVELVPGMTTDYHNGLFRIGGTLTVGPGNPRFNTPLTYQIKADYVRD